MANPNTKTINLPSIPEHLVSSLLGEYLEVKKRYVLNDVSPSQLKGGRFAEVMLRIFEHLLGEPVTPRDEDIPASKKTKILNALESHSTIDRHVRQKVTKLVRLMLDFRNNRDVAHLGGFSANSMDALMVMTAATWCVCELVRVYGGYDMGRAQQIVDELAIKDFPVVMEVEGRPYITKSDLRARQEVLILLNKYSKKDFDFLFSHTKDSNKTRFRTTLAKMAQEKTIGEIDGLYFIMPQGQEEVRRERLLSYY